MAFLRSVLHALWMLVTVVPWGLYMVASSRWRDSTQLWWMAVRWVGWAVAGARVLLGIEVRVCGMENLPLGTISPAIPAAAASRAKASIPQVTSGFM